MRESTRSHHVENLKALSTFYDLRTFRYHDYRPAVNLPEIIQLARLAWSNTKNIAPALRDSRNGKKRAQPSSFGSFPPSNKRLKTSEGAVARTNPCPASMEYPPNLSDSHFARIPPDKDIKLVSAFHHVIEIEYSNEIPADGVLTQFSTLDTWQAEEDWFRTELSNSSAGHSEPLSLDLGEVTLAKIDSRYVVTSESLWLALVPVCNPENMDPESFDFAYPNVVDLVSCLSLLALQERFVTDARLKLIIIPGDGNSGPSFRLHIELSVSFVTPTIFEAGGSLKKMGKLTEIDDAQRRVLLFAFPPSPTPPSFEGVVNIPFYYSILGPAPPLVSIVADRSMQPERLNPILLPFQRRTVGWLLDREGMTVSNDGTIVPKSKASGFTFWQVVEMNGEEWFFHPLSGVLRPNSPFAEEDYDVPSGGILAEEPGLGKTIETISLILLNPALPRFNPSLTRLNVEANIIVKAIRSTLIVTPANLASQWSDELQVHAPTLKVLVYDGWANVKVPVSDTQIEEERKQAQQKTKKKAAKAGTKAEAQANINKTGKAAAAVDTTAVDDVEEEEIVDWCSYVHTFDVVITTYTVLQSDLNVARAPPKRPRRDGVVYANVARPRSPLILVEWARVVMDEVQMAGGGKTEDMVSLIPRRSSLAVSGTPARAQVSDLSHVLKFLRFDIESSRLWKRLLLPGFAGEFYNLFKYYSVRTMKSQVSHELTIPRQTRYLVSIDMGRVERLVYDQSFETILNDLGLDARGVAASEGWEVDGTLLRSSIRRLRGICTHPQVGQLVGQNERIYKPGALKTMADVLQNMKDQNWRNLIEHWKTKIQAMIRIAQLKQLDIQIKNRFQSVLEILLAAEKEAERMIAEIERMIAEHHNKGEALKREAAEQRALRGRSFTKGKGKQREELTLEEDDLDEEDDDDDDDEDNGLPKTPAGKDHRDKRSALKHRLREASIQFHRVKFLQGDVYHNLGETYSAQENSAYATAEAVRRNLLKTTGQDAKDGMDQLHLDIIGGKAGVSKRDLLIPVPYLEQGGIRSAASIEELHEIIENVLNEQTELMWEWRSKIHSLLTQNLNSGEDDADGQEYQRTLDNQGEAETFLQAYAALLADRREALTSERTLLAAHDAREVKQRKTQAAMKAVAHDKLDIPADVEIQPEHEVLYKQLFEMPKNLLSNLKGRAVRSILVDLTAAHARTGKNDPEKILLATAVADLRKLISSQQTLMDKASADLALFRKAFNQRIVYFRQLQEISDSVAEVEFEGIREDALDDSEKERKEMEAKIVATRAHQRYLDHLVKSNEEDELDEDDKCCILCRCDFERGFITTCAHIFCEGCLKEWMGRKDGKNCPVCRVVIDMENLQRFRLFEPQQPAGPNPIVNGELVPTSHRKIDYNMIDTTVFETIQSMEAIGDYGSKIQTLVRHLMYLEQTDSGSKSIVFSAWADSLTIVERALRNNGIQSIRIDRGTKGEGPVKKFKSKPEISVLLLHGERENAGLNVTCASRVFLLESVVHHGFEIQAIARIDRMGQTRSTEVYCYYAEDTVERNILDLAARQGLSLYTKGNSAGTLNVSPFANEKQAIESPAKKSSKAVKGDFISKLDDMLAVLFPHMFEDLEYLLPPEDIFMSDVTNTHVDAHNVGDASGAVKGKGKARAVQENAVAGPSRLRR
ncbi:SNF2 family N-terminal domain-containing protein [Lentinula aciculospora]|uniref:SNF2 family N-terminal domain-containing protein n=1 Tax=Lentinula aciculospora TaxID=153920 RepID=A0A9W9AU18_9AGAR|nr:SNF2 family N-terminal domain-containing protein [Lentinula aciculospora]